MNRRPKSFLLAGVALGFSLGFFFLIKPEPAVNADLLRLSERLESVVVQAVVVDTKIAPEVITELKNIPIDWISRIEADDSAERAFFRKRLPLFLPLSDLKNVYQYFKESIKFEKDLFNPFSVFQGSHLKEPELDFDSLYSHLNNSLPIRNVESGKFTTDDGKSTILLLYAGNKYALNYKAVDRRLRELSKRGQLVSSSNVQLQNVFNHSLSSAVLLASNTEEAGAWKNKLAGECNVKSLNDFVPTDQAEKVNILKSIRKLLTPTLVQLFEKHEKKWVQNFNRMEIFESFEERNLPVTVLSKFQERGGATGRVLHLYCPQDRRVKLKAEFGAAYYDATFGPRP